MLVSHTKKFIFIKTVKTAGTSMEVALQDYCVPPDIELPTEKIATDTLVTDHGIVAARGPSQKNSKDNKWFNHMPANKIKAQLPDDIWNGYCKICNIRNPWDKTVSWFHFRNPQIKDLPESEIFSAFHAFLRPENEDDFQIGRDTHIYFVDGQPVADEYIRYETMAEDFARVCEKLGLENKALPELKRAQRGKKVIPYQNYYDAELRDLVGGLYKREIAHFGWSF